jgi:hypothetical protein
LWFPTHVVRCAAAIHPVDEDLFHPSDMDPSLGAPGVDGDFIELQRVAAMRMARKYLVARVL